MPNSLNAHPAIPKNTQRNSRRFQRASPDRNRIKVWSHPAHPETAESHLPIRHAPEGCAVLTKTTGAMMISFPRFHYATFLFLTILFTACGSGQESSTDVAHLKELLDKGHSPVVIDVRTTEELTGELGALDGIIHIPLQELQARMKELDRFKQQDMYIICRSGNRSEKATTLLNENGFHAINVEGGMKAWRKEFGYTHK